MNGTEHHCDTCTCAPPVPDLNAALHAAAMLDVRGAYSVRIDLDVPITLQGDAPDMANLIGPLTATFVTTEIRDGIDYNEFETTVGGFPVRIVSVDREPAVTAMTDITVDLATLADYTRDDIRTMHDGGTSWHEIAERLRARTGVALTADEVERLYGGAA